MANKKVTQLRYSGDSSTSDNWPEGVKKSHFIEGNVFDRYNSISQMGIQGQPGTAFVLNSGDAPIILGETGIYEIDLENRGYISSIYFIDNSAFDKYVSGKTKLLIDIIYEG